MSVRRCGVEETLEPILGVKDTLHASAPSNVHSKFCDPEVKRVLSEVLALYMSAKG